MPLPSQHITIPLALRANLRHMLFPHLKPAELHFSRIYCLIAKFWLTITLCSLCQSTYMGCNQRVCFFSHPPSNFATRWKKLMGCARFPLLCQVEYMPAPSKLQLRPGAETSLGSSPGASSIRQHHPTCTQRQEQGQEVQHTKQAVYFSSLGSSFEGYSSLSP